MIKKRGWALNDIVYTFSDVRIAPGQQILVFPTNKETHDFFKREEVTIKASSTDRTLTFSRPGIDPNEITLLLGFFIYTGSDEPGGATAQYVSGFPDPIQGQDTGALTIHPDEWNGTNTIVAINNLVEGDQLTFTVLDKRGVKFIADADVVASISGTPGFVNFEKSASVPAVDLNLSYTIIHSRTESDAPTTVSIVSPFPNPGAKFAGTVESVNGVKPDINGDVKIGTKDLPNTANFAEKTTKELENYFLKTETFNQGDITKLLEDLAAELRLEITEIPKFNIEVVETLPPVAEASLMTVYLVPAVSSAEQTQIEKEAPAKTAGKDLYTENICVEKIPGDIKSREWEVLGTQRFDVTVKSVDLSLIGETNEMQVTITLQDGSSVSGKVKLPATVKAESVPAIVSKETFQTHFYELRKSAYRVYQFEVSSGNNENLVDAIGWPEGADKRDKWFLYVDLPYSEAGGFNIRVTLQGRTRSQMWEKTLFGTLDANWQDTGWIDQYYIASRHVTNVVITSENGRYVADHTSDEIIRARQRGMVQAEFTDPTTNEIRTYYYTKQMPHGDGRAVFSKDGYIEDGIAKQTLIFVAYNGEVTVETRSAEGGGGLPQFETPQNLAISQYVLSWDPVLHAEVYAIYVDSSLYIATAETSYNLTSNDKWTDLENAEHTVKVIARGWGGKDSLPATITFEKTLPGLDTPTGLQLAHDKISWNPVLNAKTYLVRVDTLNWAETTETQTTWYTNPKWNGLAVGGHTISVIAQSPYYTDSLPVTIRVSKDKLRALENVVVDANNATVTWNAVPLATHYKIVVNDVLFGTTSDLTIDLKTYEGWNDIDFGARVTVQLTAQAAGYVDSDVYTTSFVKTEVLKTKVYSVRFTGDNSLGTREDDAVGMEANVAVGDQKVKNDFDFVPFYNRPICNCTYDTSAEKWVVNAYKDEPGFDWYGKNGEVMYECRPFFYKFITPTEDGGMYCSVTAKPKEGYKLAPMFKNDTDKVYLPCFNMAEVDGKPTSRAGLAPASGSLDSLMAMAREASPKAHLTTFEVLASECFMLWVEFANRNFKTTMYGNANDGNGGKPFNNGEALTKVTNASSGSPGSNTDGKHPCVWRGKENPWANMNDTLCNVMTKDTTKMMYLKDPTLYNGAVDSNWEACSFQLSSSDGYTKVLGQDTSNDFLFCTTDATATENTGYGAWYSYPRSASAAFRFGDNWHDRSAVGLYFDLSHSASISGISFGGRFLI